MCFSAYSTYITYLLWVWVVVGVLSIFGYSLTRKFWYSNEILAGIAWSSIFFGSYTVLTHKLLPPLNITIMFMALAILYGLITFVYRVITGDYGCPINRSVINKLVVQLFIGTMLLGLSVCL
jgi:hypothetical protein